MAESIKKKSGTKASKPEGKANAKPDAKSVAKPAAKKSKVADAKLSAKAPSKVPTKPSTKAGSAKIVRTKTASKTASKETAAKTVSKSDTQASSKKTSKARTTKTEVAKVKEAKTKMHTDKATTKNSASKSNAQHSPKERSKSNKIKTNTVKVKANAKGANSKETGIAKGAQKKSLPEKEVVRAFEVGEYIFYPNEGLGYITGLEKIMLEGVLELYYVISFPSQKMTNRVPVKNAKKVRIRKIISKAAAKNVLKIFEKNIEKSELTWKDRLQLYQVINSKGNSTEVAYMIAALFARKQSKSSLSFQERQVFEYALEAMSSEIAIVLGLERKKVMDDIIARLSVSYEREHKEEIEREQELEIKRKNKINKALKSKELGKANVGEDSEEHSDAKDGNDGNDVDKDEE